MTDADEDLLKEMIVNLGNDLINTVYIFIEKNMNILDGKIMQNSLICSSLISAMNIILTTLNKDAPDGRKENIKVFIDGLIEYIDNLTFVIKAEKY